eukprot:2666661-Alexandrium_andersonii.AAC.1
MSASLVGSEMCIRDRRSTDSSGSPLSADSKPWTRTFPPVVPAGTVASSCLLYTSDAADDM